MMALAIHCCVTGVQWSVIGAGFLAATVDLSTWSAYNKYLTNNDTSIAFPLLLRNRER